MHLRLALALGAKWVSSIRSNRVPRLLIIAFAVGFFLGSSATGEAQKARHREQTGFSAEEAGVETPIAIPEDVLDQLKKDEMVTNVLEDSHLAADNIPASWLSASSIHLTLTHKTPNLIVEGNPPLSGGNTATFWVFRATDNSHTLLMNTAAHNLIVKNSASLGYRNIELISMSASIVSTVICRFDGTKYKEYRSKSEPIR